MFKLLSIALLLVTTSAYSLSITFDKERTVRLVGEVGGNVITDQAEQISKLSSESQDPIYMLINSPGGAVMPGSTLIDAMQMAQARGVKLICVAGSLAASMAFQVYAHCDERYAFAHTKLLFHPMSLSVSRAKVSELATLLNYIVIVENRMKDFLVEKLGMERILFEMHYAAETMWEAQDLGTVSPDFLTIINDVKNVNVPFSLVRNYGQSYHIPSLEDIHYQKSEK